MSTRIEWCDETINPVIGCSRIDLDTGCKHCYAVRMAWRLGGNSKTPQYCGLTRYCGEVRFHRRWIKDIRWTGESRFVPSELEKPLHWRKPRRVFVSSMGDLFYDGVKTDWHLAVMDTVAACPQHTFLFLTKRPENMRKFMLDHDPLPNLHLGVSCSTHEELDRRVPVLLDTPAAVRFVSLEPLLEPCFLQLGRARGLDGVWRPGLHNGIDQVIVGGETGPGARPMHPDWVRTIRDQCQEAGVPFFLKSLGEWRECAPLMGSDETADGYRVNGWRVEQHYGRWYACCGRKVAGRLLDGVEHNDLPESPT